MKRSLAFVFACLWVSGTVAAAEPRVPARFELRGELQADAPPQADSRFELRARLAPVAPQPDPQLRFVLKAELDAPNKAACALPDEIFANGFEGS